MANKKILLYGIGSLQNRGCEALVNSTIAQFDSTDEIIAATFDYENDKDMYKDRIKKFVNHHKHDEEKFSEDEKTEFKKLQQQKKLLKKQQLKQKQKLLLKKKLK